MSCLSFRNRVNIFKMKHPKERKNTQVRKIIERNKKNKPTREEEKKKFPKSQLKVNL